MTTPTTPLQRVATGDPSAVRACIDRYGPLVWALARRQSGTTADAEDAVQEIFVELWRNAARFDATVASEPTFVAMIARRRLIDRRRRQARRPSAEVLSETLPDHGSEHRAETCVEATLAAKAVATLRPEQRQVLLMSARDGLSHDEIATATGMPLGTVKTHARRALIKVRALLLGEEKLVEGAT
jgi:RNA polymerase sigma factor (sigma-70 family)